MAEIITGYLRADVLQLLHPRQEDSHKGTFGTLLALCGCADMPGAAYLSAMGALRSGVGLLKLAAEPSWRGVLQARLSEPVWITPLQLFDMRGTAFLCGPGLGRTQDELLERLLVQIDVPAVYDADCINFLSLHKHVQNRLQTPYILTPHPAEFARLTGLSAEQIRADRAGCASRYAVEKGCVLVLKGHETVVAPPNGEAWINTTGSSALAKGGSGDVLAGVIASLLAQGHSCETAAKLGVYVHGLAGERVGKRLGTHGALPSDLPEEIGRILG